MIIGSSHLSQMNQILGVKLVLEFTVKFFYELARKAFFLFLVRSSSIGFVGAS